MASSSTLLKPLCEPAVLLGWLIYFGLVGLRLCLVMRLQPGYLHPDEFFQSVEVGAGDVYAPLDVVRTWEFQPTGPGPIRSIAGIAPFVHLPIWLYRQWVMNRSTEGGRFPLQGG